MRKTIFTVLTLISLSAGILYSENAKSGWIKTSHSGLTVIYSATCDAARLHKNLRNRITPRNAVLNKKSTEKEKANALAERVAQIFNEVIKRSDIKRLRVTGRERIVIVKSQKELADLYFKFYGKRAGRCISFYSAARKTIYTSEYAMSAKILAHEMTHMVNDLNTKGTIQAAKDEKLAYRMEIAFKI